VSELAQLKVDQDEALKEVIVEDEVDVEMLTIKSEKLLPTDEREAFTELEKEILELIDERSFQIVFAV